MKKTYAPDTIEQRWYQHWEKQGYFRAAAPSTSSSTPYCIMLPPPNVTGTLHMGHAFQHTLMDILIRHRRMQGHATLWQPGTDHAGIATQMVVERQLNHQGHTRHDLGRQAFLERVWQWKGKSGNTISQQMRRLGMSPDWERERFTMDDGLSQAVNTVFVRLYREDLIYRGKRLVNWDPKLHTAVSDLEVENRDEQGHLWHLRYPLADGVKTASGKTYLVVATTRPETLLGDTAVAVHPDDVRYNNLIGKDIELPLTQRRIPIIADPHVEQTFGTGCVKVTPAHDFNDYDIGKRHHLPLINIFTINAEIRHQAEVFNTDGSTNNDIDNHLPIDLQGLDRFVARKKIIETLESLQQLESIEKHALKAPYGDRSGVIIEPMLTDQWFVKTDKLAQPAIKAVEEGRIKFIPKQYQNMYFSWMRELQDWCISRQLWWGHRIPAWYDNDGNIYVGESESAVRQHYQLPSELPLQQDEDVLDTWFSSALWPFSTLGWPEHSTALKTWYPTDVLITGFDIIFFWVARMIMMGMHFIDGEVPFKEVYITGLVRDENGQKMSKSKGNVLDPLDLVDGIELDALIEKRSQGLMQPDMAKKIEANTRKSFPNGIPAFGSDALRFTLASLASTGRDIKFDLNRMEGYRNFCNKLWNAARYVLMQSTSFNACTDTTTENTLTERWIRTVLQQTISQTNAHLNVYRFDLAAKTLYEFIWNEYCDWYIELCKPVLHGDETVSLNQKYAAYRTLVEVLEQLLRLCHPFIPFISEEIWQQIKPLTGIKADSIMTQPYPHADTDCIDHTAVEEIDWIKSFVLEIRRIRAEFNVPPGKLLNVHLHPNNPQDTARLTNSLKLLQALAHLETVTLNSESNISESATARVNDMEIHIPLAGLIDKTTELKRLNKEIEKNQNEHNRITQKLNNANFIGKAPKAVVDKEKDKLTAIDNQLTYLQTQYKKIKCL